MDLLVNKPRERMISEITGGKANMPRAEKFIDDMLDDFNPDKVTTGFASGDIYTVRKCKERGIPHRGLLPWKAHVVGKKDYREYCELYRYSQIEVAWNITDDFQYHGTDCYRMQQEAMVYSCDALVAVWHQEWSSAKTLMNMMIELNKPVVCYLVRTRERLLIHDQTENIYSKERLDKILERQKG